MTSQAMLDSGWRSPVFASKALDAAARCWFATVLLGQAIFSMYIVMFYYGSTLQGNFARFNQVMPAGYIEGDGPGNVAVITHVMFAALITMGGLLQLLPGVRRRLPALHRWNGRIYVLIAIVMSLSGAYMIVTRTDLVAGGAFGHTALMINGGIILLCAVMAFKFARRRQFANHRVWALRLFVAVSGVWMFRIGMMAWLGLHGAPVGFDPVSFTGPFLTALHTLTYIVPLLFLEVYLRAKAHGSATQKLMTASGVALLSVVMLGGVLSATFGMWLPRI
ncbi:MAG: DUF2306 domain-containing protein [Pseudomonadota bacterium]|nr:DUF2306 domain-containing protein [Pseudomonadota bacterium]